MTETEVLHERARRHGLERRDDGAWTREFGGVHYVGHDNEGWWSGDPSFGWYASEAAALSATLDRLDHERPELAHSPSVGAQLAEASQLLRNVRAWLFGTPHPDMERKSAHAALGDALRILDAAALPHASDEGQVLQVAWDYLCERGVTEGAREALVAAVRHCPEVVGLAKVARWSVRDEGSALHPLDAGPQLAWVNRRVRRIGREYHGYWRWELNDETSGEAESADAAREACARALPEWVVLEAPAPPAPAAETALEDDGHAWTGAELEVCTNMGCRRWRRDGWHVTAENSAEAMELFGRGIYDLVAGPCAGWQP